MIQHEKTDEILNDLVKINNDRIAGYERAIYESKDLDIDLKAIFESMIRESYEYKNELSAKIGEHEGHLDDDTTTAGKIYRAWIEIKSAFTDSDRLSILAACEFTEDATQRAYEAAVATDTFLDTDTRQLILDQKNALKLAHDMIKQQREAHTSLQEKLTA